MCALKGNHVRQQPKEAKNDVFVVSWELIADNHNAEPCMDGVTVNRMSVLHGMGKMTECLHVTHMPRTKAEDCHKALDIALQKSNDARFVVTVIHCDWEFKLLMDEVEDDPSVMMNCTNPHEHKPTTERANCTLKGRVQTQHGLSPFKNLP